MTSIKSLEPDAVFVNAGGTITMENASTPVLDRSLTAIAVRDGVIVGLGTDDAITQMAPGRRLATWKAMWSCLA